MSHTALLERDIQRQIIDWLKLSRIWHMRLNTGAMTLQYRGKQRFVRFAVPGAPDILACVRGKLYGIEVKKPDGLLSEDQEAFGFALKQAGAAYIVARCLEDVIAAIP